MALDFGEISVELSDLLTEKVEKSAFDFADIAFARDLTEDEKQKINDFIYEKMNEIIENVNLEISSLYEELEMDIEDLRVESDFQMEMDTFELEDEETNTFGLPKENKQTKTVQQTVESEVDWDEA